jgi:hypothetical protein
MVQVTLHLDDETQMLVEQSAHEWPQNCLALAGGFADFPLREETPAPTADAPRVICW